MFDCACVPKLVLCNFLLYGNKLAVYHSVMNMIVTKHIFQQGLSLHEDLLQLTISQRQFLRPLHVISAKSLDSCMNVRYLIDLAVRRKQLDFVYDYLIYTL